MSYEAVIGLEVHAQMLTKTKIFCGCSTQFGHAPNTQTCPVCLGMPGVLPVLNKQVVEYAMKTGLATNCRIRPLSRFARKNYFYPDLPKGYQISQYELPIAEDGFLEVETHSGGKKKIGITRIHMEEDAGKLVHELEGRAADTSYVDFNRTGVPLIEIVSEPDMRSPAEAGEYLRLLRSIVQYLEVCDGNMEQGSFRCDANVSVRRLGTEKLGTKVELKNMNSFRHVERALEYEIRRQIELLEEGDTVVQETRLWDDVKAVSFSMRSKEEAHDYRYFPDPDLVPLVISEAWVESLREGLPELPGRKKLRFEAEYGLSREDAARLAASRPLAEYFESCTALCSQPKLISNWILGEVMRCLDDPRHIREFAVSPRHLVAMIEMIVKGIISGKIAKTVFNEMISTAKMPEVIVEEKGLVQVSDSGEIDKSVQKVIDANPDELAAYRRGKKKLMGFFVGQVMKATGGKANPKIVNDILRRKLEN